MEHIEDETSGMTCSIFTNIPLGCGMLMSASHTLPWAEGPNDCLVGQQLWLPVQTPLNEMSWWEMAQELPLSLLVISSIIVAVTVISVMRALLQIRTPVGSTSLGGDAVTPCDLHLWHKRPGEVQQNGNEISIN